MAIVSTAVPFFCSKTSPEEDVKSEFDSQRKYAHEIKFGSCLDSLCDQAVENIWETCRRASAVPRDFYDVRNG